MADLLRKLFTGIGLAFPGGTRVSYQWLGYAVFVEGQTPIYQSLVNGSIEFKESANVSMFPTTAYNGFQGGTVGTSIVSGSVKGWVQASDSTPSPQGPAQSFTSQRYWLKILIGTVYYECVSAIQDVDFRSSPDEAVEVTFNFTFLTLPAVAQFTPIIGGTAPQ